MKSSVSELKTLQSRLKGEILGQARRKERLSRSKLKQAFLIDSDVELFLYLIQCIRFGSWKVRRPNRALQTHHSCCLRSSLFHAWSAFKFQRTAVSTGFVQKCLWNLYTLIFTKVNGNFASDAHRYAAVKSILRANLQEHNLKRRPNDSIIEA